MRYPSKVLALHKLQRILHTLGLIANISKLKGTIKLNESILTTHPVIVSDYNIK